MHQQFINHCTQNAYHQQIYVQYEKLGTLPNGLGLFLDTPHSVLNSIFESSSIFQKDVEETLNTNYRFYQRLTTVTTDECLLGNYTVWAHDAITQATLVFVTAVKISKKTAYFRPTQPFPLFEII
jgi:hypothetical protein